MMNKKGNVSRIILWCLFFIIIGFLIYSLVLTYKEIKKKNPSNENVSTAMVDIAPRFAYVNEFQYSANDYITSAYVNFYKNASITHDVLNGVANFDISAIQVSLGATGYDVYTACDKYWGSGSIVPYYVYADSYKNDNVLYVSDIMQDLFTHANHTEKGFNQYFSYFDMRTLWSNAPANFFKSAAMILNCNIPINEFNYTLSGTYNNPTHIFLKGDVTDDVFNFESNFPFTTNDLPVGLRANNAYITKIIIPCWQSRYNGNLQSYMNKDCNYDYNLVINGAYDFDMNFSVFTRSNSYQDGYNAGYSDGVQAADSALQDYNTELVNENTQLKGNIDSLNSRITQQQNVISQLQYQIDSSSNNFRGLFFTMADIPFKTVHSALGFEFWGVNLFEFFVGVLTALGIIWLIKKIL